MALNPPPLKLYDCASLTLDDIHEFVKGQGYVVSTFRSKTDKQSPPTVRKMAKGNSYKRTARRRLTSSRMTDCPFELTLTRTAIGWQVEVQEPTHNHEAFAYAAAVPHYRGRGRARGGSSKTTSRGGSSQISSRIAL
jgi:hypothetical protein